MKLLPDTWPGGGIIDANNGEIIAQCTTTAIRDDIVHAVNILSIAERDYKERIEALNTELAYWKTIAADRSKEIIRLNELMKVRNQSKI